MKPVDQLKELLGTGGPGTYSGRVTALSVERATVQTVRGSVNVARPTSLTLSVGDDVLVTDGVIRGRLTKSADVPTYRM